MIAKKNRHLSVSFFSPPGPVLPFGFFGDTTQKWRQQALTQEFVPKAELGQSVPRPDPTKGFRPDLYPSKPRWDHSGYFGYVPIPRKIICQTKVLVVICCHVFTSLSPVRKQQECEWGVCVCNLHKKMSPSKNMA